MAHTAAAHVESLAVRIEQIAETSPLAAQYCLPILEALAITAHNEVINLGER